MSTDEIVGSVRRVIQAAVGEKGAVSELGDDTDMFESAFLDSVSTVELIAGLELEFGVKLRDEEVFSPRFTTIRSIAELMEERKRG